MSDLGDHSGAVEPPPPALVVAALAFSGMTASFMQTILIPIQSDLPGLLGASREDAAWVITITLLVSAIFTPISGRLGDMYGKRRVALVLLGTLMAGSVVAALSLGVVPLIVGRGMQGLGLGIIPLGISILRDTLPENRLGSGIALVSATLGVGGALGLPLSAWVSESADWRLLFWFAAGLAALCLVLVARIVPPSPLRTGGRLDVVGAVGLAVGLSGILLGISRGNEWGWTSSVTLALFGGGAIALLLWGAYELRVSSPLVDLRVSARRPVLLTNLASIAMGFALFASNIAFPQLVELPSEAGGLGLSLLLASLVLMPSGLAMLAVSPVAGRLERRTGPKPLLVGGAAILAVAYLVAVLLFTFGALQVWHVLLINVLIGTGIGLGYGAMPNLIMRAVPRSETGAANGLNTLMRALGTSIAAATVATVLSQSAMIIDGSPMPTADGFRLAFLFGLGAALLCAAIAASIPRPGKPVAEHAPQAE